MGQSQLINILLNKNYLDPCLEYESCHEVGNATLDRCEPFNATYYECHYSCIEGYFPINLEDISQGCLGGEILLGYLNKCYLLLFL